MAEPNAEKKNNSVDLPPKEGVNVQKLERKDVNRLVNEVTDEIAELVDNDPEVKASEGNRNSKKVVKKVFERISFEKYDALVDAHPELIAYKGKIKILGEAFARREQRGTRQQALAEAAQDANKKREQKELEKALADAYGKEKKDQEESERNYDKMAKGLKEEEPILVEEVPDTEIIEPKNKSSEKNGGAGKTEMGKVGRTALFGWDLGSTMTKGLFSNLWKFVKVEASVLWRTAKGEKPPSFKEIWSEFFPKKEGKQ